MRRKNKINPVSDSLLLAALEPIYNGGELDEATVVADRNTGKQIVARTVNNKPVDKTEQRKKEVINNIHKGMTGSAKVIFEGLGYLPVDPIGPIATNIAREIRALPILGRNLYDDYKYIKAIKKIHPQEVKKLRNQHFLRKSNTRLLDANGMPELQYHTVQEPYDPTFTVFNPAQEQKSSKAIYTADYLPMSQSYAAKPNKLSREELEELLQKELEKAKEDWKNLTGTNMPKEGEEQFLRHYRKVLGDKNVDRTKALYVRTTNPIKIDANHAYWGNLSYKDTEAIIQNAKELANKYNINFQEVEEFITLDDIRNTNFVRDLKSGKYGNDAISDFRNLRTSVVKPPAKTTRDIEKIYFDSPHDAVIIDNVVDYGGHANIKDVLSGIGHRVVETYDPRNLKLAAPITRDNKGKLIRLSQRDNFLNPDIRYSLGGKL